MNNSLADRHRPSGGYRNHRFPAPTPAKENCENSIVWQADETALSNKPLKRPLKVRRHRTPISFTTLQAYIFCVDEGRLTNRYTP